VETLADCWRGASCRTRSVKGQLLTQRWIYADAAHSWLAIVAPTVSVGANAVMTKKLEKVIIALLTRLFSGTAARTLCQGVAALSWADWRRRLKHDI
jgi:hypothetical protein